LFGSTPEDIRDRCRLKSSMPQSGNDPTKHP
jgi:hypothetical protein